VYGSEPARWLPDVKVSPYRGIAFSAFVPFWCLIAVTLNPTVILWRRGRRIPAGYCESCGYDLTGNESGVCPEYGTTRQP